MLLYSREFAFVDTLLLRACVLISYAVFLLEYEFLKVKTRRSVPLPQCQ